MSPSTFKISAKELDRMEGRFKAYEDLARLLVKAKAEGMKPDKEQVSFFMQEGVDIVMEECAPLVRSCRLLLRDNQEMVSLLQYAVEHGEKDFDNVHTRFLEKLSRINFID